MSLRPAAEGFFGELYLESTRPFLTPQITAREVDYLKSVFDMKGEVLLDVGCGHGRHLRELEGAIGVDRDRLSLKEASSFRPVVRADLRQLPFRAGAIGGAFCWYNGLSTFEEPDVPVILGQLSACMKPGATLVIQQTNPAQPRSQPEVQYDGAVGEGRHLREWASYNAEKCRDDVTRELALPDGRLLQASYFIRYYEPEEWRRLLEGAGFGLSWCSGGFDGVPISDESTDLIVGATRR